MLNLAFILYMSPVWGILLYIIIGFFIKIFKDIVSGKASKNNVFKNIDTKNAQIETVENSLNNVSNYHKIIPLTNDMFLFINEYDISLIMVKNYSGQIYGKKNDEDLIIKNNKVDSIIKNPIYKFKKVEEALSDKLSGYKYNNYLIIGSVCIININFDNLKIIRMDNYFYLINKIGIKKAYSKEEIDKLYENICKVNNT